MSALADEVLRAGLDDDVPLLSIDGFARRDNPGAGWPQRRQLLLTALAELLSDGLIEVGDLTTGRFVPWQAQRPEPLGQRESFSQHDPRGQHDPREQHDPLERRPPNGPPELIGRLRALTATGDADEAGQQVGWGFAAWVSTTSHGDDRALELIERESCMDDGSRLLAWRAANRG
jgi:hypothetical protein